MNLQSKRHHYIPQFFIKAFANENGSLWVYDKEKDLILKNPKHPRNIFYEDYLNSIKIHGEQLSIVEKMYNGVNGIKGPDDFFSPAIKELQYKDSPNSLLTTERLAHLNYFIAQLTWRVPSTEKLNKAVFTYLNQTYPKLYSVLEQVEFLDKEDLFKLVKFITPTLFFRNVNPANITEEYFYEIISFKEPIFCLSDNPIIWKRFPFEFADFSRPLIFPISKDRVFLILEKKEYNFSKEDLKRVILVLMHQAKKYVAGYDKSVLENHVDAYRVFKGIGDKNQEIINLIFENLKVCSI